MNPENFINNGGGFAWFTGVVEDIDDPLEMGRYRVRCFGYHNADKTLDKGIPTEDLPWSNVMLPITSASMTGIGQSATGLLRGSWVIGFFRDGINTQDPVIMGSIPSMSVNLPNPDIGFNDPDGVYPRSNFVKEQEVDTPRPARDAYILAQPYISKEDNRQVEIETATPPRVSTVSPDKSDAHYERKTWDNHKLEEIISPTYPKNHVVETESGHIIEYDDTPNNERISQYQTSGTYEEVVANGDKTITVVGNEFEVTFKNKNMYVKGNVNLTVDGNMKTLVKGDYQLEVEGDKTEYIKGNSIEKVGLNKLIEVDEEYSCNVSKNYTTRIGENEIRDVIKDSTTNITGSCSLTTSVDYTSTTLGSTKITTIGDHYIAAGGTLTGVSAGTMKLDTGAILDIDSAGAMLLTTAANLDIDSSSGTTHNSGGNIVVNGSNIFLN